MFCGLSVLPTLPVANMERAKKFYDEKLGLQPAETTQTGEVIYRCNGSSFFLYSTQYAGTAKNTAMTFQTDDLERDMRELRGKGVKFEEYNLGELKTVNGVATIADTKGAWFKDTEGNIIALTQRNGRH
jgi:catechol 2,3-dioxygenase-like lactoylglutathione lyase family enzyme